MKLRFAILLACLGIAVVTGTSLAADVDREMEKLQGTWTSVSYEGTGLEKDKSTLTLTFDDDRFTMIPDGEKYEGVYDLDVDESPKRLDFTLMKGLNKAKHPNKGIYQLDGDTLKICHGGVNRPTQFALRPTPAIDTLIVLKRKRP